MTAFINFTLFVDDEYYYVHYLSAQNYYFFLTWANFLIFWTENSRIFVEKPIFFEHKNKKAPIYQKLSPICPL